jgi:hypothetical protein
MLSIYQWWWRRFAPMIAGVGEVAGSERGFEEGTYLWSCVRATTDEA